MPERLWQLAELSYDITSLATE